MEIKVDEISKIIRQQIEGYDRHTSLAEVGAVIFRKMLDVASGEPSKSEALGIGDNEFVPWQVGAYL